MAKLALQLTCYNGSRYLPYLFASLKEQSYTDWELYVLDNGSSDQEAVSIAQAVENAEVPIVFERVEETLNFAPGHNYLFSKHNADYVQLLNDDAVLDPDYLRELVAHLDANGDVGAVTGAVYQWRFELAGSAEARTSLIDSLGLKRKRNAFVIDRFHGAQRETLQKELSTPQVVFGVSGCLPLYRRASLLKTSPDNTLFDASFTSYKEDVEVGYRFARAGIKSVAVPSAQAWHRRSNSPANRYTVREEAILHSYRNHLWLLMFHVSRGEWLRWGWLITAFELAKAFHWLVLKPRLALAAWRDTMRAWPELRRKRQWYKEHLLYG